MKSDYRAYIKSQVQVTLLLSLNLGTVTGRKNKFVVLVVTLRFSGFCKVTSVDEIPFLTADTYAITRSYSYSLRFQLL